MSKSGDRSPSRSRSHIYSGGGSGSSSSYWRSESSGEVVALADAIKHNYFDKSELSVMIATLATAVAVRGVAKSSESLDSRRLPRKSLQWRAFEVPSFAILLPYSKATISVPSPRASRLRLQGLKGVVEN